jgi:AcrR family transcriptional regulator
MVIRYFGSKKALFAAVAKLDFKAASLTVVPIIQLGGALVRHILDMWENPKEGAALAAMMRASIPTKPRANASLRNFPGSWQDCLQQSAPPPCRPRFSCQHKYSD